MKLSVIIPCYNAGSTLGIQLTALAGQHWSDFWEIIVVDNGCTDDSMDVATRHMLALPHLRIVGASKKRGAYYARNVGARAASADVLLFCDADDEVAPGWLEAAGQALLKHDVIACRIDVQTLNPLWSQIHDTEETKGEMKRLWFPPYASMVGGGYLGVKRSVHEAIGGFDESWPRFGDAEYSIRLQLAGHKIHFVPSVVSSK